MKRPDGAKIVGLVFVGLMTAGLLGLVLGLVVMWLWNALMPGVFGLPEIGYWQAVGLFILAHLLFKSPGHHDHHAHKQPAHLHPGSRVREKIKHWLDDETDAKAEEDIETQS